MRTLIGSFVFLLFVCASHSAHAATLYLDPNTSDLYAGDTLAIDIRLDTAEGECVNAIDGIVTFSDNIAPVDISLGESIFPVWVEAPTIEKEQNRVVFAGGIPNGYCGRISGDPRLTNVLATLIVQSPAEIAEETSEERIGFDEGSMAFLNDGNGTRAQLRLLSATVTVHKVSGENINNEWQSIVGADQTPPSQFSISLNQESTVFGGDYFVVFNTTDKQSGIDHYEVIEEPLDRLNLFGWGAADAPWIVAKSPYRLKDQSLNSIVRVKAVDKAGNEIVAVYVPDKSIRGFSLGNTFFLVAVGIGLFVIMILVGAIVAYRRKVYVYEHPDDQAEHTDTPKDTNNYG